MEPVRALNSVRGVLRGSIRTLAVQRSAIHASEASLHPLPVSQSAKLALLVGTQVFPGPVNASAVQQDIMGQRHTSTRVECAAPGSTQTGQHYLSVLIAHSCMPRQMLAQLCVHAVRQEDL